MIDVVQLMSDMRWWEGTIIFLSSCVAACLIMGFVGMGDDFNE